MGFISDKKTSEREVNLANTGKLNLCSFETNSKISDRQSSTLPSVFSFKNGGQIRLILFVPSTDIFF